MRKDEIYDITSQKEKNGWDYRNNIHNIYVCILVDCVLVGEDEVFKTLEIRLGFLNAMHICIESL